MSNPRERIQKLRAKAADPVVTFDERIALLDKARALEEKYKPAPQVNVFRLTFPDYVADSDAWGETVARPWWALFGDDNLDENPEENEYQWGEE